jgi:hypothetical protein
LDEKKLDLDDREFIVTYLAILKPCNQAKMEFRGDINTNTNKLASKATKRAFWRVLPMFIDILKGSEESTATSPTSARWNSATASSAFHRHYHHHYHDPFLVVRASENPS